MNLFRKVQELKARNLREKIQKLRLKQHQTNLSNAEKLEIDKEILDLKTKHHQGHK